MKDSYIKLPIVKKIEVKGYRLFEKDWEYTLKKGLNLFVGGNRLGKTTTIYIILYGIVGIPQRSKNFFADRVKDNGQAAKAAPKVILNLQIGKENIEFERDLSDSHINYFSVNRKFYNKADFPNIDDLYAQEIIRLAGISSLPDYRFLLEKLLIREEEANYLLWAPDDQMRALRLLFNYGKFDEEFRKLKENVRRFDTKVRGQQDIQAQFKKRLKAIQQQKLESIGRVEGIDLAELQKRHQLLEKEANKLKPRYKQIITDIESIEKVRKNLTQATYGISSEVEELDSEIIKTENILFQSVYSDPKIQLANHKLKQYQICIFCNQKIPQDKVQSIVSDIQIKKKCPVCSSGLRPLIGENIPDSDKRKLVEALLDKRKILEQKRSDFSVKQGELDRLKPTLDALRTEERKIREKLEENILEIDDIKLKLSKPEMEQKQSLAVYDRDIRALESQIQHYQSIIDEAKIEHQKATKILEDKNKEFSNRLEKIRADLLVIFKAYASRFLGECELVAVKRKTDESIIYTEVFVPKFDGSERIYKSQVSNSEATFLEYVFRMSLCQLFKQITGGESLLAIETSEGLFDTVNVPILAEAISKFCDVSHLLVVSNLGRPDFLGALVKKTKQDISDRVLNFLDIGKLSEAQEREKGKFNEQLRKILVN